MAYLYLLRRVAWPPPSNFSVAMASFCYRFRTDSDTCRGTRNRCAMSRLTAIVHARCGYTSLTIQCCWPDRFHLKCKTHSIRVGWLAVDSRSRSHENAIPLRGAPHSNSRLKLAVRIYWRVSQLVLVVTGLLVKRTIFTDFYALGREWKVVRGGEVKGCLGLKSWQK